MRATLQKVLFIISISITCGLLGLSSQAAREPKDWDDPPFPRRPMRYGLSAYLVIIQNFHEGLVPHISPHNHSAVISKILADHLPGI